MASFVNNMEDWKEYKLKDICIKITDGSHSSPRGVDDGYPMFSVKDMQEYGFDYSKCKYVSYDDFLSLKQNDCVPQKGDVLVAKDGSYLKQIFVCKETRDEGILSSIAIFRPNTLVDSFFLCYLLKSPEVYNYIANNCVSGSALPRIVLKDFKEVKLRVPSLTKQKEIVSILKSLDDKIEVNRKINENLEQQAQALFKSWFVDFEPFKDGEFVESELGMIPKGWRVGTLGEICTQSSLKVGVRNDVKVLSPVTTGNLMLSEEYFTKQVYSESIAKYKVVNRGAFAYNPARVNIGSLGRNEYDFDGAVSPVYVVFECNKGYSNYFDLFRTTEKFKTEVLLRAIGGVRQSLNYVDFAMIQTIIAPQEVVDSFNPMYERLKTMQKHLEVENNRLATIRDTLLPKLMSGELKVNEVEISEK